MKDKDKRKEKLWILMFFLMLCGSQICWLFAAVRFSCPATAS